MLTAAEIERIRIYATAAEQDKALASSYFRTQYEQFMMPAKTLALLTALTEAQARIAALEAQLTSAGLSLQAAAGFQRPKSATRHLYLQWGTEALAAAQPSATGGHG